MLHLDADACGNSPVARLNGDYLRTFSYQMHHVTSDLGLSSYRTSMKTWAENELGR